MIVSNEFRPDARVLKEAKALVRAGFEVSVLGWDRESSGLPSAEVIDGVSVRRARVPGGRYGRGIYQLGGYFLFYLYILVYFLRNRRDIDILHAHEADLLPVSSLVKAIFRVPLIVDLHELYSGRSSKSMNRLMRRVEERFLKYADGLVVVNDRQAVYYRPFLAQGVPVLVLPNYPEKYHLNNVVRSKGPFTVSFFGTVRNGRQLIALIDAAKLVGDVRVLIAGTGTDAEMIKHYVKDLSHAKYLGPFTYADQPELYSHSDVVYVVYPPSENALSGYPVKLWEALVTGQPVIISRHSDPEEWIVEGGAGVSVTGENVEELAHAMRFIKDHYQDMSKNARRLGQAYSWENVVPELLELYGTVQTRVHKQL